jgi:hypothetical protein
MRSVFIAKDSYLQNTSSCVFEGVFKMARKKKVEAEPKKFWKQ